MILADGFLRTPLLASRGTPLLPDFKEPWHHSPEFFLAAAYTGMAEGALLKNRPEVGA